MASSRLKPSYIFLISLVLKFNYLIWIPFIICQKLIYVQLLIIVKLLLLIKREIFQDMELKEI